jgi:hypothetical protein
MKMREGIKSPPSLLKKGRSKMARPKKIVAEEVKKIATEEAGKQKEEAVKQKEESGKQKEEKTSNPKFICNVNHDNKEYMTGDEWVGEVPECLKPYLKW